MTQSNDWPEERKTLINAGWQAHRLDPYKPEEYEPATCPTDGCSGKPKIVAPADPFSGHARRPCPECGAEVDKIQIPPNPTREVEWLLPNPDPDRVASRPDQGHKRDKTSPTKRGEKTPWTPRKDSPPTVPWDKPEAGKLVRSARSYVRQQVHDLANLAERGAPFPCHPETKAPHHHLKNGFRTAEERPPDPQWTAQLVHEGWLLGYVPGWFGMVAYDLDCPKAWEADDPRRKQVVQRWDELYPPVGGYPSAGGKGVHRLYLVPPDHAGESLDYTFEDLPDDLLRQLAGGHVRHETGYMAIRAEHLRHLVHLLHVGPARFPPDDLTKGANEKRKQTARDAKREAKTKHRHQGRPRTEDGYASPLVAGLVRHHVDAVHAAREGKRHDTMRTATMFVRGIIERGDAPPTDKDRLFAAWSTAVGPGRANKTNNKGETEFSRAWNNAPPPPLSPEYLESVERANRQHQYRRPHTSTTGTPEDRTAAPEDRKRSNDWEREWPDDPAGLARQILHLHAPRILVVLPAADGRGGAGSSPKNEVTAYALRRGGIWDPRAAPWCTWTRQRLETYHDEAMAAAAQIEAKPDAKPEDARKLRRRAYGFLRTSKNCEDLAQQVRRAVHQAAYPLAGPDAGTDFPELTICNVEDLDRDTSMMGTRSGVIDLRTAKLLSEADARKKLITTWTPVRWTPDADQAPVDQLFEHQPDKGKDFLDGMGHAMHGQPSRRFYTVVGEPNGGKTAVLRAVGMALGPQYCTTPPSSAMGRSRGDAGEHTAGLELHMPPARVAVYDDVELTKANPIRLKQVSGDSTIGYRKLRENPRQATSTATVFFASNPEEVPVFGLKDEALADRIREIEWAPVPRAALDPDLKQRWTQDEALREALLVRLVEHAAKAVVGRPPESDRMKEASASRLAKDIGEIAHIANRLKQDRNSVVASSVLWEAWCKLNDIKPERDLEGKPVYPTRGKVGGTTRTQLFKDLRRLVRLPESTAVWDGKKTVRGYAGWHFDAPS